MRILVVSQYFYPEQFQINEIVAELVQRGHDVTVVTGHPNYPTGMLYEGYEKNCRSQETIYNATVCRVPIHPRKKGVLHLIWNYFSFQKNASR